MHLELNLSETQLDSDILIRIRIELEINEMQIGGKCIENMLMNMMLKKTLKHKFKKTSFHASLFENGLLYSKQNFGRMKYFETL
jgi:hypothetical protein